jgi:hypothetical protein
MRTSSRDALVSALVAGAGDPWCRLERRGGMSNRPAEKSSLAKAAESRK